MRVGGRGCLVGRFSALLRESLSWSGVRESLCRANTPRGCLVGRFSALLRESLKRVRRGCLVGRFSALLIHGPALLREFEWVSCGQVLGSGVTDEELEEVLREGGREGPCRVQAVL